MKIVVNINKKYFFGILVAMFLLIGVLVAFAYDSSFNSKDVSPSVAGHSADEVNVKLSDGTIMTLQEAIQAIENGKLGKLDNGEGGDGQNVSGFKHYMDVIDDKTFRERRIASDWTIPHTYGSPPSFLRATLVNICNNSGDYSTELNIEDLLYLYLVMGYAAPPSCYTSRVAIVLASNTTISVGVRSLYPGSNSDYCYYIHEDCWKIRVRAGWV